jgi:hypothetical protein
LHVADDIDEAEASVIKQWWTSHRTAVETIPAMSDLKPTILVVALNEYLHSF